MQDSSLQHPVDCFIQPKVLVTGENIPHICVKKMVTGQEVEHREVCCSLREMWRCMANGASFSDLRIVNKMKQIS